MKIKNIKPSVNFLFVAKNYLFWVVVFFLFRLALYLINSGDMGDCGVADKVRMFLIGLRFDTVIACYLLVLPAVVATIETFAKRRLRAMDIGFRVLYTILAVAVLLIMAADIPYFQNFFQRLSMSVFNEMEGNFGTVVKMIAGTPAFLLMLVPVIALAIAFWIFLKKTHPADSKCKADKTPTKIVYSLLLFALIFIGMRGNVNFKQGPIHTRDAYFSTSHILNQLGLNPCFVFIKNTKQSALFDISFTDNSTAVAESQRQLGITEPNKEFPLMRMVEPSGEGHRYNIVLVLMESMSAYNMQYFGYEKSITPFLDSLAHESLFFENCYTSGKVTSRGIYSSIVGYPTIYAYQPLNIAPMRRYNSMAHELKRHGYSCNFFVSHEKEYDNCNNFLLMNSFDKVYSKEDYPESAIANSWGVADDFLFEYALGKMDSLSESGSFFTTLLTISNHEPFVIPEKYRTPDKTEREQMVSYCDDMLRQFFAKASQHPWFDSTIFVLVADHGKPLDNTYPLPLSLYHSPLIFYAPSVIKPQISDAMASQKDIFPTVMGILQMPYCNNTFGIDLLRESRPYAMIMNEQAYGIVGKEWYMVRQTDTDLKYLFRYRDGDPTNHIAQHPQVADSMEQYAFAQWQAAIYLLKTGKTFYKH